MKNDEIDEGFEQLNAVLIMTNRRDQNLINFAKNIQIHVMELRDRLEICDSHSFDGIHTRDALIKELDVQLEKRGLE